MAEWRAASGGHCAAAIAAGRRDTRRAAESTRRFRRGWGRGGTEGGERRGGTEGGKDWKRGGSVSRFCDWSCRQNSLELMAKWSSQANGGRGGGSVSIFRRAPPFYLFGAAAIGHRLICVHRPPEVGIGFCWLGNSQGSSRI